MQQCDFFSPPLKKTCAVSLSIIIYFINPHARHRDSPPFVMKRARNFTFGFGVLCNKILWESEVQHRQRSACTACKAAQFDSISLLWYIRHKSHKVLQSKVGCSFTEEGDTEESALRSNSSVNIAVPDAWTAACMERVLKKWACCD